MSYRIQTTQGTFARQQVKAITQIPGWAERLQSSDKLTGTGASYAKVPLVFRALNLRCNALVEMPWHLYKVTGRELKKVDWPFETQFDDLLWRSEASLLLAGAGFWV
jgi:hypothetical protein